MNKSVFKYITVGVLLTFTISLLGYTMSCDTGRYDVTPIASVKLNKKISSSMSIETIVIGGGCFWCTESVFRAVKGVTLVECAYAGGGTKQPTYMQVISGDTEHAEVVKVTFDAKEILLEEILMIFMATHDPTTLNRQGYDVGKQYRSVVFYTDEKQKMVAQAVIKELQAYYDDTIVTELSTLKNYYRAEEEHQDYYTNNPEKGYCNAVILPKLQKLRKLFADKMK